MENYSMTYEAFLFSQLAMNYITRYISALSSRWYDELYPIVMKAYEEFRVYEESNQVDCPLYDLMDEWISKNIKR